MPLVDAHRLALATAWQAHAMAHAQDGPARAFQTAGHRFVGEPRGMHGADGVKSGPLGRLPHERRNAAFVANLRDARRRDAQLLGDLPAA